MRVSLDKLQRLAAPEEVTQVVLMRATGPKRNNERGSVGSRSEELPSTDGTDEKTWEGAGSASEELLSPAGTDKSAPNTDGNCPHSDYTSCCGCAQIRLPRTLNFTELPEWRQYNPFIRKGYRWNCSTHQKCFSSWFSLHNETFNIWSHFLGFCTIIGLLTATYADIIWTRSGQPGGMEDVLFFAPFFFGACMCLGCSTLCHTFESCDEKYMLKWTKMDYVGISVLIWGSYFPIVHYFFLCDWHLQLLYLGAISLASVATICVSVMDRFAHGNVFKLRALLFTLLGACGLVPILHFTSTHTIQGDNATKIAYLIVMGIFYLLGAIVYSLRVPERCSPGSMVTDIFCGSHLIFHLLINAGAVCHWLGSVYDFRHIHSC